MDVNDVIVELNRRVAALEFMLVGVVATSADIDKIERIARHASDGLLPEHADAKQRFEEILSENFRAARSQAEVNNG